MEVISIRPRLVAFRVSRYQGEASQEARVPARSRLKIDQRIDVGFAPASAGKAAPKAIVRVMVTASVVENDGVTLRREHAFVGEYEGKFEYPKTAAASALEALFAQEAHQYLLVAQVFPLAMTHFRRQLLELGVRADGLPLGI